MERYYKRIRRDDSVSPKSPILINDNEVIPDSEPVVQSNNEAQSQTEFQSRHVFVNRVQVCAYTCIWLWKMLLVLKEKGEALLLLTILRSFDFVFNLHLMKDILRISNDLSKALQRKDLDIVNAMTLVKLSKERLQNLRDSKWPSFLEDVNSFCRKHDISIIQMDEDYVPPGRSRRYGQGIKNLHQYQVELFYVCIDKQLAELNNRFDEVNMELLVCMSCLNPKDDFVAFDTKNLVRLAEFYPDDFSEQERMDLENQLEVYEMDMKSNDAFKELNGISSLAKKLVETGKDVVYNWVYKLIKLLLILPIATPTVERAFSAMNIVKSRLRNRMGDEWLNDCLITYIERENFKTIKDDVIMQRFQKMKPRKDNYKYVFCFLIRCLLCSIMKVSRLLDFVFTF